MRKALITLICLFAMMAASLSAKAQDVTVTIKPGCTWFSYPKAEVMDIASALGDFVPMEGDVIKSQYGSAIYQNGIWRGFQDFTPGWGYKYYSTRTENVDLVFRQASYFSVITANPIDITATSAVVGGTVDAPEGTHVFLRGVCWGMAPSPDIDGDNTSEEPGTGSFSTTLEGLTTGFTYYVRAYAVTDYGLAYGNEVSFTTGGIGSYNGHYYVDLGLPSGTLWATCNVGADSPEGYGYYFAWGETQPKDAYDWENYQFNFSYDNSTKLIRYCNNPNYGFNGFTDDLTTLLPVDDAATAFWGDGWCMPTKAQWDELCINTTNQWVTQDGVNGCLFTASNGNSLFLPAAGIYWGEVCHDVGDLGHYWSSSLYTDDPTGAWGFFVLSDYSTMHYFARRYGQSVRPVRAN